MLRVLQGHSHRLAFCLLLVASAAAQKKNLPQPAVDTPSAVTPGDGGRAPSDAVALFNGHDLSGWARNTGQPTGCIALNNEMVCKTGSGDAYSNVKFTNAQIHLEFQIPLMANHKGQMRGNSGVYLQTRFEVQILDSFNNPTYADGSLGAVYGEAAPLVNAARPPGEWQTYDITFHGHQCDASGQVVKNGTVSVMLNGVLVQDHHQIRNIKDGCTPGGLMLQDHSGFKGAPTTELKFRNLWLRHLN